MAHPFISIIIPNYNGKSLLEKNLPKVFAAVETYKGEKEIIISDDASSDESLQFLQEYQTIGETPFPLVVLASHRKKNRGFAGNVNRAVMNAKGDIIILLNTDVVPEKDFLLPLLSHFENENVFAVGCMDKSIENGGTILRGRGIGRWKKGFLMHQRGEVDKTDTLWVSCGSGAFRKTIWLKLGGLDELYNPFYWEDLDLSYRALKAGYSLVFDPKSMVQHEHEKGTIKNYYQKRQIQVIAYRNQFFFVWKNCTDWSLLGAHVLWLPYHVVKTISHGDFAFVRGFFRALLHVPEIYDKRKKLKKITVKKDLALILPA